jgi:phosphatidylinositol-bisphosphatase
MGRIHFQRSITKKFTIKNIGIVRAHWHFKPKPMDIENTISKPWLEISPILGILLPNETVEISIKMTVDAITAYKLNQGREILDDILILGIENGFDFFVTVKAQYARSCYGMSVIDLLYTSTPVRFSPEPALKTLSDSTEEDRMGIMPEPGLPKEIWWLVDALFRRALDVVDLFVIEGNPEEVLYF